MSDPAPARRLPRAWVPYLLIAPALLYYALFWLGPVLQALVSSLTTPEGGFTLAHYGVIMKDADLPRALLNTAVIVAVSVALEFVLALGLALLINMRFRGAGLFLFLAMIPMALPPAAVGAMWKSGFVAHGGWLNSLLQHLGWVGLESPYPFLAGGAWECMFLIILIDAWQVIPFMMILLLAGLQNLPAETCEAGYVFGGNAWTVFRRITVPMLKPTIQTALLLRIISAIQIWLIIVMLFGMDRLPVLLSEVLDYQDVKNLPRVAMAYSILVALVVSAVAVLYLRLSGAATAAERKA